MAAVPLILLAGPIVRRVEPRLAAVWVALNQPRAVRLVVYDGRQQAPVSAAPLAAGAANTLRVGAPCTSRWWSWSSSRPRFP